MRNPADFRDDAYGDGAWGKILAAAPEEVRDQYPDTPGRHLHMGDFQTSEFLTAVQAAGYDGLVIPDALGRSKHFDSYIAFCPNQIKYAKPRTVILI